MSALHDASHAAKSERTTHSASFGRSIGENTLALLTRICHDGREGTSVSDGNEPEEIHMPEDPARLVQHGPVDVLVSLRTSHGEERVVLGGRTTTQHLRPNGAIVVVRPQFTAGHASPLKRAAIVKLVFRRSGETIDALGAV